MRYLEKFSKIIILGALTGSFLFSFKGGVLIMERLSTSTSLQGQNYREFFISCYILLSLLSTTKSIYFLPRFSFRLRSLLLFYLLYIVWLSFYLYRNNITSFNIDYPTKYRVYLSLPAFYFWRREIRYKPIVTLVYHYVSFYTLLFLFFIVKPHSLPAFYF